MNWIWMLLWLLLAAIVGVVVRPFWDEYSFQILTIVVFLNVIATITLWRKAARRPEKLKKRFLNRLWRSKPITPKHEPPPLKKEWVGIFGKNRTEQLIQFFSDFEDFGNVVNSWLADPDVHPHNSPWRLQELPNSELSLWASGGGPAYGRTYAVFHNQVRIGEIEVRPDWGYSTQDPRVTVHIELDWVRLLSLGTIRRFLVDIAEHVSEYRPGTVEYVQTNQQIDLAMTSVLWETQEVSQYGFENEPGHGQIEVELDGSAGFYLERRQVFRNQAAKAQQQQN
jgi:hypothetical protein